MANEKTNQDSDIKSPKRIAPVLAGLALFAAVFIAGMLFAINNNISFGSSGGGAPDGGDAGDGAPSVDTDVLQVRRDDLVQGDGDVLLIEYSDYECGFCRRFHPTVQSLVDAGEVTWVYRHFPLPFHQSADEGAAIAECVRIHKGNDVAWSYTDLVFSETPEEDPANADAPYLRFYRRLGSEVGLTDSQMDACLASGSDAMKVVDLHLEDVRKIGITGTPGSYLVNKRTKEFVQIPGAVPVASVRELLESVK